MRTEEEIRERMAWNEDIAKKEMEIRNKLRKNRVETRRIYEESAMEHDRRVALLQWVLGEE